jgi:hypothetical protein
MTCKLRLGSGREGAGLFVPHMHPVDPALIDRVGDPVARAADNPVAPFYAGGFQDFDQQIGNAFGHGEPY